MASLHNAPSQAAFRLNLVYLFLILAGAGLRIWQFVADTSLYIDEIAVARDVLKQPVWALLTQPLSDQVAPKGFLLALKCAVWIWGPADSALRIFALVCSLASLVLFWRIAVRLRGGAGPLALALFAGAIPLITFSSEVKQYASDVFITVLLLWLVLELVDKPALSLRARWLAAITGLFAAWFSHAGDLVIVSLAAAMFWIVRRTPSRRAQLAPLLSLWIVSAVAAANAARSVPSELGVYVHRIWAPGFMPLSTAGELTRVWPWDQMKALLSGGAQASLNYPAPALCLGLMVIGLWELWRRQRELALCLSAPVAAALAAAAAQVYPFSDRLILFLVPIFLLTLSVGIETVRRWASFGSHSFFLKGLGWVLYGALGAAALSPLIKMPPVYHVEDMKPVLAWLRAERRTGDRIYTYYGAAPATAYYAGRFGLRDEDYAVGGCHRGDGRRYLQEIDSFRGNPRVWVLLTHSLPEFQERADILRYLDTIGTRRQEFVVSSRTLDNRGFPAEVYLYDLSDSTKLGGASAPSFPLMGPVSPEAGWRCLFGPQVMIAPRGI
jgi:hypothetical protein